MDKLSLEEFKRLGAVLEEIATCPVCYGPLRSTTVVCVNGHVICDVCKQAQTKCPTCKDDFSSVKTTGFIKQVIEALPHTCRHKDCEQLLVQAGDDHELYCGFRPTTCKCCNWTGPVRDVFTHVKTEHPRRSTVFLETSYSMWTYDFNPNVNRHWFFLLVVYNHVMWWEQIVDTTSKVLKSIFHIECNGKIDHEVFLLIEFKSDKSEHVVILKLNTGRNINSSQENCFCVPTSILHNFIDDDEKLNFTVGISKERPQF